MIQNNIIKKKLIILLIIFIFLTLFISGCNETNNKQNNNVDGNNAQNFNPFNTKKVIFRDDDVGASGYLPSVRWLVDLAISKKFKVTFSIMPTTFSDNPETIDYLKQLNQNIFEFATHGYDHEIFKGLPYYEQYSLIEMGTNIIKEKLNYTALTFVPPYGSCDSNTTRALSELGYHSTTDMSDSPSFVTTFISDFDYETSWSTQVTHCSFEEFKNSFDNFYNSSDEYFIICFHDWTFLNETKNLNESRTDVFEKIIDYLKSKNVQFMKFEEAYESQIDESVIKTGMNQDKYYIDLRDCYYNHTIKINPPTNWNNTIYITDNETGKVTILDNESLEFNGIKDHLFYLSSET